MLIAKYSPVIFTFSYLQTLLKLLPLWTFANVFPKYNKLGQRRVRKFLENVLRWFRLEILCECGKVYVGQRVGCWGEVQGTPEICTSEHKDSPSRYLGCLIKEAVEIHLKKSNFNRDFGIILSQAWSPLTSMLLNKNSGTKHSKYLLQPPLHFVLPPSPSQGFWQVYYDADGCMSYFPVDKDRDLLRTLICSPFNYPTWLLAWDVLVQIPCVLHYNWMVYVWGVVMSRTHCRSWLTILFCCWALLKWTGAIYR